jgi:heme-degrading monooxygenase HmoA
MTFVAINVLTVPDGAGRTLEERFSRRAGSVESSPGFEHFELLRPVEGTSDYLVYTRWRSRDDYETWTRSASFARGHSGPSDGSAPSAGEPRRPAATASTIWAFDVVQEAGRSEAAPGAGSVP